MFGCLSINLLSDCLKYKKNNKISDDNDNLNVKDNNSDQDSDCKPLIIGNDIYVECAICFEVNNLSNIQAIYPCGHRLYCNNCIKKIKINSNECPNCRKKIDSTLYIYEYIFKPDEVNEYIFKPDIMQ